MKKKRKKRNEQWSKSIICNTCTNHWQTIRRTNW